MGDILSDLLEEKEPTTGSTVLLPISLWKRLDELTEETKKIDPKGKGRSRNAMIAFGLTRFCDELEKELERRR